MPGKSRVSGLLFVLFLVFCSWLAKADEDLGKIVVANRASGSISVIDVASDEVTHVVLPTPMGSTKTPEPMYVNYAKAANLVLVGDRAHSQVVAFDPVTYNVVDTVPTGAGIFHQWANTLQGDKLWVNNDADNTITVIDTVSLTVDMTIPLPADLGGRPHDVVLTECGTMAFVTLVGVDGPNDYVIKYKTRNGQELARAAVGKDPHVSVSRRNNFVYVMTQEGSQALALTMADLTVVDAVDVPSAHGAGTFIQMSL